MRNSRGRAGAFAGLCSAALTLSAGNSHAVLNAGPELGFAQRSSTPGLGTGLAVGAHAELQPLPMLSLGAYYLYYGLPLDSAPDTAPPVGFRTFGARARFKLDLPRIPVRPYGYIGIGRVGVTYPSTVSIDTSSVTTPSTAITERSGRFVEVPIGLGAAYGFWRIFEVSLDFSLRPGFAFAGDAYSGMMPFQEPKTGYAILAGLAVDL